MREEGEGEGGGGRGRGARRGGEEGMLMED